MFARTTPALAGALLGLVAALGVLFAAAPLRADEQTAKKVVFAYDNEFPPFTYEREGKPAGYDIDLIEAILKGREVKMVYKAMNWENVLVELSAGNVHMTSGMIKTKQRLSLYNFCNRPTVPLKTRIFTKNYNRVSTLAQLRGKRIAVKKETLYQVLLDEFGGFKIIPFDSDPSSLKALYNDQVDAFCGADRSVYWLLDKLNLQGISAVGIPLRVTNVYYAFNRDQAELLKWVNDGMARIRESGEYYRIFRKWFVKELSPAEQGELMGKAKAAIVNAYAPYSRVGMGGAVLGVSGKIYAGCNVENGQSSLNASGLQVAILNAVSSGESDLRGAVEVLADGRVVSPNADERRLLYEFGPEALVITEPERGNYVTKMVTELLPYQSDGLMETVMEQFPTE